jgi:hypothetical protein
MAEMVAKIGFKEKREALVSGWGWGETVEFASRRALFLWSEWQGGGLGYRR